MNMSNDSCEMDTSQTMRILKSVLTNANSWAYSKRQISHWVDAVLIVITESFWIKALRVRIVARVTVQPKDGDEEYFSWINLHRRVRLQYVRLNTKSIHSYGWRIQSEGFCECSIKALLEN